MNYLDLLLDKINSLKPEVKDKIDLEKIKKAYFFAEKAHDGQFRASGEPYIIHPVEVARIVLDLKPETETIVSAILHDVVEDTIYSIEEIEKEFGEKVAKIVDGLTKVSKIDLSKIDSKVGSLRKMFIAMAKDLRVVFIKLSDRYHNLMTIWSLPPEKQKRIAQETLDIYVPVAERLGIYKIKTPIEDICFKILNKADYLSIEKQVGDLGVDFMNKAESKISNVIKGENVNFFEISGRVKGKYSIYKKMTGRKNLDISEVYDIFAIRVIIDSIEDCYKVLGIIHKFYRPLSHRFKDYISTPKPNGYRSLHTVVIGLGKEFDNETSPIEIQIRTKEMHFEAEYGAASHWSYKEGIKSDDQSRFIKNLIDLEDEIEDNDEFLRNVHIDVLNERIFALTPQGDIIDLPKGATVLDFAFSVHSEIGFKCVGATVNGKGTSLDKKLQNGDTVKIITRQDSKPNPVRLRFVKTTRASTEIKKRLSDQNKDLLLEDGIDLLNKCFKRLGKPKMNKDYLVLKDFGGKKLSKKEREELIEKVGSGVVSTIDVIKVVLQKDDIFKKVEKKDNSSDYDNFDKNDKKINTYSEGIYFKGGGGENYKLMKTCCDPVFGDEILGYVGRGATIGVHKKSCPFIKSADYKRFIKGFWKGGPFEYSSDLEVQFLGLANNSGRVFKLFDIKGVEISRIDYTEDLNPNFQTLIIGVNCTNLNNFSILIEKIGSLDFIHNISVKNLKG